MTRGTVDVRELTVSEHELRARLGPLSAEWATELSVCREGVLSSAVGHYIALRLPVTENDGVSVTLGGHRIESVALAKNLRGAESAFLFAVTLGAEVDRYLLKLSRLSVARHAIADGYASALAEALCDKVAQILAEGLEITPRFSPGYGDLPLTEQGWLLDSLGASRMLGIGLSASLLMSPLKSVSAIMGIKKAI